jgi:tripartite-type tricarboxylate transporter receptor subunit TctC
MKSKWFVLLAVLGLVLTAGPACAGADFSGKTITWIVPFKVGGGTDGWARIYAPFFHQYLPGQPTIAVKNMPGGGSITGGNFFETRVKPDGLTVLGNSGSTTFPWLLGVRQVKYDFAKYKVVFGSPTGGVAYIKPDLGVKSAADLKGLDTQLYYASQGATSLDIIPLLAFDMLGLKVKATFGYKGRGAGRVAYEQGEVNIDYQTTTAYIKNVRPLVKAGEAVPLMSWGVIDENGDVVRDPVEPDLPCFPEVYEMVHGKKPSGPAWKAWKAFMVAGFGVQKCMWLPGDTSDDIVETYRAAAAKIVADPKFQEKIDKSLGGYSQLVGERARKAFEAVLEVSPEDTKWLLGWLKDQYGVEVK